MTSSFLILPEFSVSSISGMAVPGMFIPPVIMSNLDRTATFIKNPWLKAPVTVCYILCYLLVTHKSHDYYLSLHSWNYNTTGAADGLLPHLLHSSVLRHLPTEVHHRVPGIGAILATGTYLSVLQSHFSCCYVAYCMHFDPPIYPEHMLCS